MKTKTKIDFDSVIMPDEKKETIVSSISQLDNHDKIFIEWGFEETFEKGTAVSMIFHGIPGTGKTLMAEAISNKLKQELLTVGPAEIETNIPGGAERNIQRYFKIASGEMGAPTGETDEKTGEPILGSPQKHVLLFDECDGLITNRGKVGMIIAGQINTLLTELERFTGVVIFTTNRLGSLDPALERRITSKIEFEFPDSNARKLIWSRMIPAKAPIGKDVDFNLLAEEYPLTGGNIKNVVLNAARTAAYQGLPELTMKCFKDAIENEIKGMASFEAAISGFHGHHHHAAPDIERSEGGDLTIDRNSHDIDKSRKRSKSFNRSSI